MAETALLDAMERRILIVEDDPGMKSVIESVLKAVLLRPTLRWAYSKRGAELLLQWAQLKNEPFDLVICDVNLLGEETGVDLYRQYSQSSSVPFMFLTACREQQLQAMFQEFKQHPPILSKKSFNPAVCIEQMKSLLGLNH